MIKPKCCGPNPLAKCRTFKINVNFMFTPTPCRDYAVENGWIAAWLHMYGLRLPSGIRDV